MSQSQAMQRPVVSSQGARQSGEQVLAWVRQAMDVLAPQWPLQVFVARHPWPSLEHLSFADALAQMGDIQDVHLHPEMPLFRSALKRGDIALPLVHKRLEDWMNQHVAASLRTRLQPVFQALLWPDEQDFEIPEYIWTFAEEVVAAGEAPRRSQRMVIRSAQSAEASARLTQQTIKWCKLYLDAGQAAWSLPGKQKGLYVAWRHLIMCDPALRRAEKRRLAGWPTESVAAITAALNLLHVAEDEVVPYLRAHLAALPGWAGLLSWQGREHGREIETLVDYLALRLSLEWALCDDVARNPVMKTDGDVMDDTAFSLAVLHRHGGITRSGWRKFSPNLRKDVLASVDRFRRVDWWHLWLTAWEDTLAERMALALNTSHATQSETVAAQFLFCIDVRSEPFRRNLEAAGPFATYGCAGFFNLAMKTRALDSAYAHPSCPAIVAPTVEVKESMARSLLAAHRRRKHSVRLVGALFKKVKQHVLASLALPELSGPWLAVYTFARTLAPAWTGAFVERWLRRWQCPENTELVVERVQMPGESEDLPGGWTVPQMAEIASGLLRSIGLTQFAPLVVICGHESLSTNNAHAAALDCGACGGAAGRWNARVFAAICNRRDVRAELGQVFGIWIPDETIFIAAEHVTTTDELVWIDRPALSGAAKEAWDLVQSAVQHAQRWTAAERLQQLPDVRLVRQAVRSVRRRAHDWSEVRPEWGLAGNRAFIIGRRSLTQGTSLSAKAFLHSYDWRLDPDGDLLASIISGPVTVAQWINLQYYASTVAPDVYGSGNKTTQTVTSGLGVMQGNGSDLLAGLPWQSVASDDRVLYHAPLRLWVVIEAPETTVEQLFKRDPAFCRKVDGGWLRLASLNPLTGRWRDWSAGRSEELARLSVASAVE
ncbi:UPF0753 protein [Alicyclobacillus hesperidum subsp. aegles]|uniref:DUF2309 domain-containing protein n=1 Tax=Alicyclobacillus hesperidum TaxID=89784 RepID=UPI00222E000A|nr:DUF2309 domain-containing protein [Alicyclobacillus hesperidum]GLG02310.1 UPF0753 protein [Alicyclobacillus hesperidum subsp. aegles]